MPANPDFCDLFRGFNAAGVEYLVIGAHAVIHCTEPRLIKDLDLIRTKTATGRPQDLRDVEWLEADPEG